MDSVNLVGRLTKDPEIKYIGGSQTAVCNFTLAIDRPVGKDKDKVTDFIPCTVLGKAAENMEKYTCKGKLVGVEGRLQSGSYVNKNGAKVYTLDVFCNRVHFIEWKDRGGALSESERVASAPMAADQSDVPEGFDAIDEDIPF